MRELPRIAVMERRMLTAENVMDCCFNSPTQTGEHCHPSKSFVCEPLPVIFVVAIIVVSILLQVILKLVITSNISP